MTKLFKTMPEAQRRSVRFELRMTQKEAETIRNSADIRNLSTAEFIRRAGLGRRADVQYETQIVLALRDVIMEIRKMYAAFNERGITPPIEVWRPLVDEAISAIHRLGK